MRLGFRFSVAAAPVEFVVLRRVDATMANQPNWAKLERERKAKDQALYESQLVEYESCCVCDSRTGRAGRGEDSIYRDVLKTNDELFHDGKQVCNSVDDEVGPLCEDCLDAMSRLGFFADEEPQND